MPADGRTRGRAHREERRAAPTRSGSASTGPVRPARVARSSRRSRPSRRRRFWWRLEPAHRSLDELLARVGADRGEPAHHRPRAVDVVHAPAAVPGAVVALGAADDVERAIRRLEVEAVAQHAEQLEAAPGQIFGGRVEQRAVVGERDVVQIDAVVVGVERRPAAVLRSASRGTSRARAPWPAALRSASTPWIRSRAMRTMPVSSRSG